MTRTAALQLASAWLLTVGLAAPAWAVPAVDTGSVSLQGGWRYEPNARFGELAAQDGHALSSSSPGGPSFLATFGYRPLEQLEVDIEIGFNNERWHYADGSSGIVLNQIPITLAVRWSPFLTRVFPYVGLAYGYLLNFYTSLPGGVLESHGSGPAIILGGAADISSRVSLFLEYRYAYTRVQLGEIGAMQVGGSSASFGFKVNFTTEPDRIK